MAKIHPDLTAYRAVDACGGAYSEGEEESGFANGHRNAIAAACEAVVSTDELTAELLESLTWAVRQIDASMIETEAAAEKYDACVAVIAKATQP